MERGWLFGMAFSEWISHFMSLSFFLFFFYSSPPCVCVCNEILAKTSTDCSNHPSVKSQWGMAAFPLIPFHLSFLHSLNSCFICPFLFFLSQACRDANRDKRKSLALAMVLETHDYAKQIKCRVLSRPPYKRIHSPAHIIISLV